MNTSKLIRENIHNILSLNNTLRYMVESTLCEIGHYEFDKEHEPTITDYENRDLNVMSFDMSSGHMSIKVYDPYENPNEIQTLDWFSFSTAEVGMQILIQIGEIYDEENPE